MFYNNTTEALVPPVVSVTIKAYLLNELPVGVFKLKFSNYDISDESVSVLTGDIVIGAPAGEVVKAIQMVLIAGKII